MSRQMKAVHLIHGFNEDHQLGQPSVLILKDWLMDRGLSVMVHDYGHWDLIATRNNENVARLIYPHVRPGDTLVGYSNGAAIIAWLESFGVQASRITLIQPALKNTWTPNKYCDQVNVYWNPGDKATIAGKWWRRVTSVFPWRWQSRHNWGEMGHTGYRGPSAKYTNYQTDAMQQAGMPKASGHSGWRKAENRKWRKFIADRV